MTASTRPHTDPRIIRAALERADESSTYRAARELGLHSKSITRWQRRRDAAGGAWPTDADIAAWDADHAANAAERARKAEKNREYRKRVYLNRGPLQVPILGTQRRIRALSALGWTFEEMANELGVTATRVGHLAAGYWDFVFPSTAESVDAMYRRLCMTVPDDPEPTRRGQVRVHDRCRKWARGKGWAPPLAWDDIDTDRWPQYGRQRPPRTSVDEAIVQRILDGEVIRQTTTAERLEAMRRWLADGRSERSLCLRMGWKDGRYTPPRDDMQEAS